MISPINEINQAAYMRSDTETRAPGMIICPYCYENTFATSLPFSTDAYRLLARGTDIACPNCKTEFWATVYEVVYSATKHRKSQGGKDA